MAVVLIAYPPSREVYEQVVAGMETAAPPGCIVHTASEVDGKVRVVDVWESQEAIDQFFETQLGPAFAKAGVEPVRPELSETFDFQTG
jgi:quinol monooxygenase YgiN